MFAYETHLLTPTSFGFYPCSSMHIHKFQPLPTLIKPNRQSWLPMIANPFLTYVCDSNNCQGYHSAGYFTDQPQSTCVNTCQLIGLLWPQLWSISPTSAGILWPRQPTPINLFQQLSTNWATITATLVNLVCRKLLSTSHFKENLSNKS